MRDPSLYLNKHMQSHTNITLSWLHLKDTRLSVTKYASRCYKTFPNGHLGGSVRNTNKAYNFIQTVAHSGAQDKSTSCQWQWMLKTASDQSETAGLQYGRSDHTDDHKEGSNSRSWRTGRMQMTRPYGLYMRTYCYFLKNVCMSAHILNCLPPLSFHIFRCVFTSPHVAERIITKEKKLQYAMGFTHLQCTADRKYLTEQDYKENIVEFRSKR